MGLLAVATVLGGCASLPDHVERPVSRAMQAPEQTTLGRSVAQHIAAHGIRNPSGFRLLGGTEAAYTSRLALVDAAERTLDLQYYAVLVDPSTDEIMARLRAAAARGVRIRILLDDFNTAGVNARFLALAFEPNIEMRLFNPLPGSRRAPVVRMLTALTDFRQAQRRMHNKVFIADNVIGITGGRNLGDPYFGQSGDSNFVDMDVLAAGKVVRDMSASFDAYWNNPLAYPVPALLTPDEVAALRAPPTQAATSPAEPQPSAPPASPVQARTPPPPDPLDLSPARLVWAPSLLLVDHEDKIAVDEQGSDDTVVDGLLRLMQGAQRELFIISPYFVPGEQMMDVFAQLRARKVRVQVLTNSLASNDAPLAHVGYARYRERLLALGVELFEMRAEQGDVVSAFGSGSAGRGDRGDRGAGTGGGGWFGSTGSQLGSRASLHAKVLVLDQSLLVVGSMNLDLRSQLQNSEIALLVRSRKLSQQALQMVQPTLERGAYRMALEDGRVVWHAPPGTEPAVRHREPDAGRGLQLMLKLVGPFAPDELL